MTTIRWENDEDFQCDLLNTNDNTTTTTIRDNDKESNHSVTLAILIVMQNSSVEEALEIVRNPALYLLQ